MQERGHNGGARGNGNVHTKHEHTDMEAQQNSTHAQTHTHTWYWVLPACVRVRSQLPDNDLRHYALKTN